MTSLRNLEIFIQGDNVGWQYVDADDFKQLSLLENLKTVKIVIEDAPATPLEDDEKPEIYENFISAITSIGPKPFVVVVNCDPQYTKQILDIGYNIRVRQNVRDISEFAQEIKNDRFNIVTYDITGNVNDVIDNNVIQKYGIPVVELSWMEDKPEGKERTFDLSKYNALYDFSLSIMDVKCHWVLPTNLTRLSVLDENIVNLSQLQDLQILIRDQIPQCPLNQLTNLQLFRPKKVSAKEINDIGNVKEFSVEYFREEVLDLKDLKATTVHIRNFFGKTIILSNNVEYLDVACINVEQLVIPKSVKTLICNQSDKLITLHFEEEIQLESITMFCCKNLNKFTLPKSVKTLKLQSDIKAKVLNIQDFKL
ncbi:hypothetical protein EIN_058680 [Entamoeba invadens IP1]|uniref:hypothetical protein n=1 Tax=Entamoeba invadens IP1 TaxID=370355 RepID=UPI0002C3DAE7|nr:hypothetical protein EIN_058680 [Entamoeba invadens IP1]ELP93413.1 hypothetical protein EIN_058680 [Entamoeba invadens IP1]|eukprot:XP_004260184.1 hypothetical protein EIN_058680 [Entamoeba invadens IP1]